MKTILPAVMIASIVFAGVSDAQWKKANGPYLYGNIFGIAAKGSLMVAGTYGLGILVSADDGSHWAQTDDVYGQDYIQCVCFAGPNIIAGSLSGYIYTSTDDGVHWTQTYSSNFQPVQSLFVCDSVVYAGGAYVALRSTDDGITWSDMGNPLKLYDIEGFGSDDSDTYAAAGNEGVFRSTDNGMTWSLTGNPGWTGVSAIATLGSKLLAAAPAGLYISTDRGAHWTADSEMTDGAIDCIVTSGSRVCVGSYLEGLYISPDSGVTWVQTGLYKNNPNVYSIAIRDSTIIAGTRYGGVYQSNDNGNNWTQVSCTDSNTSIPSMAFDGNELIACTSGGLLCVSTDGGESWSERVNGLEGSNTSGVMTSGADVYLAGDGGFFGLYESIDNCVSWSQFGTAQTLLDVINLVDGCVGVNGGMNNALAVRLAEWASWTQYTRGLNNTNIKGLTVNNSYLFAGTWGGGVYRSSNGGMNWSQANNGLTYLGVSSIVTSGSKVFAGTFDGGVFVSTDDGSNWTQTNLGMTNKNIHTLASFRGYLFAAADNGDYVSASGGLGWTFAGLDSDTTYTFVPGDSDVYAGTSGGIFHRSLTEIAKLFPTRALLSSPADDSTGLPDSVSLTWTPVPKAASYWVQVAYDSNFVHIILNGNSIDTDCIEVRSLKPDTIYYWRVSGEDSSAIGPWSDTWSFGTGTATSVHTMSPLLGAFALNQNYPNPFNPTTTIIYDVPFTSRVTIDVYDVLGQKVETLVNNTQPAGEYHISFNGSRYASGIYFYRMMAQSPNGKSVSLTRRLVLLK